MDEGKGKSAEIEEWMKELLPDGAADIGMWQPLQHTSERRNTYPVSADSNTYPGNLSQCHMVEMPPGCNSTSLTVKQEPFNVVQHTGQTTVRKILETQSGIAPECALPRLQMPAFHQSPNLTLGDQLKPGNQSQAMLLGPLQGSTPQVDLTSSMDWVNPAFHKIQQMKEVYLSELQTLRNRAQEMRLWATNVETANRSEMSRTYLEKLIKFLNTSRSDLVHWRKENLYQAINDIMKKLYRLRPGHSLQVKQAQQTESSANHFEPPHQIQLRENYLQPPSLNQSLRQGGPLSLPQTPLSSFKVSSSMANTSQYNNPMRPTQQWAQQGSAVPSPHKVPQAVFDQRALRMLLHPSTVVSQQSSPCPSQQTAASSRTIINSVEYTTSHIAQAHVYLSPSQNNQQYQPMKRQKMKQPVQQLSEKNKQQTLQKLNEDTKLRRFVGFSQRWSPVLPPSSPYTGSPQNSQQSSSQLDLKDLSSKFSKSATPSQSASPSALPSPMTTLTPSSNPTDSVKSPLIEESSKLAKPNATAVHLPLQDKKQNQVFIDAQRLTKSCLHRESTCSGDKQSSHDKQDPFKRLVEVVKTISRKALNATLWDINAVTASSDRIAEQLLHGHPKKAVFHDLADDISNPDNGVSGDHGTETKLWMKRKLDSVAFHDSIIEMEFYESGRIKRLKIEPNKLLLQEIKEINRKLIEVVVDVLKTGSDEITVVRCSYIPIGLFKNIKTSNISKLMFPNLLLDLTVCADYPNSSPTVLEDMPTGFSDCEEGKYLWMKTKSSFSLSLRKLSQPLSLKEIAETWDICGREVFHEFAVQIGGCSFSSTYGNWENCAAAG